MAPFATLFIALLGASSATIASRITPEITVTIKPFSEVSRTLNLSNMVHASSSAAFEPNPDRRLLLLQERDGVDCLFPGPSGSANIEDCNDICSHFLNYPNDWVHVPPLDIITWRFRTCQFGLVNLDPCRSKSFQLGQLISICQGMMAECVMNGYDAYYDGSSDRFAAALTGDDAAPPYDQRPC